MNWIHITLASAFAVLAALVLRRIREPERRKPKEENPFEDLPDMNESFLEHAGGREAVDLVRVFNPQDRMVLRSILFDEGIESYVKSNIFGELYPTYDIHNFATSVISVYREDGEKAKEITQSYILTLDKKNYSGEKNPSEAARAAAGAILLGVPPKLSKFVPELLI